MWYLRNSSISSTTKLYLRFVEKPTIYFYISISQQNSLYISSIIVECCNCLATLQYQQFLISVYVPHNCNEILFEKRGCFLLDIGTTEKGKCCYIHIEKWYIVKACWLLWRYPTQRLRHSYTHFWLPRFKKCIFAMTNFSMSETYWNCLT